MNARLVLPGLAALAALAACADVRPGLPDAGTPELRAALFDSIVAMTARREAFSAVKNDALGFDPLEDMRALRDDVVGAETEEALFYALARLSHARRDRHLDVALVPDGLAISDSAGVAVWDGEATPEPLQAPVRVFPDYGVEGPAYFVGDVADDPAVADGPSPGERVVAVNGRAVAEHHETMRPWIRHSTAAGLAWKVAEALTQRTAIVPPALRSDSLRLEVQDAAGATRTHVLPYREPGDLRWRDLAEPGYPDTELVRSTPTYDLLQPTDGRPLLILVWRGFRETMVADVDSLVALAVREGLLDHALVVDVTRSRGGSLGPYALQRLQPRPFRTTFGTLRLSDVIDPFIDGKWAEFAERDVTDGGVPETVDDGTWLMVWLEEDVRAAGERGDSVTEAVPFKLAHAPREADGVLQPAPVHFRGPLVVFSGPHGGSHLDQFVSIVVDNGLGWVVGMPAGGYSNTWEWEEIVTFPGPDRPLVGFMWSIGHTVRPNGEVLEGNPAAVDAWVPLTAENVYGYYEELYARALEHLAGLGHPAGRRR